MITVEHDLMAEYGLTPGQEAALGASDRALIRYYRSLLAVEHLLLAWQERTEEAEEQWWEDQHLAYLAGRPLDLREPEPRWISREHLLCMLAILDLEERLEPVLDELDQRMRAGFLPRQGRRR